MSALELGVSLAVCTVLKIRGIKSRSLSLSSFCLSPLSNSGPSPPLLGGVLPIVLVTELPLLFRFLSYWDKI